MIPSLDTERMWFRPVRLEDAEQVQKIFPQWEIVKHLGAVVPWSTHKLVGSTIWSHQTRLGVVSLTPRFEVHGQGIPAFHPCIFRLRERGLSKWQV